MTATKRRPDPGLMRKAADAREGELCMRHHPSWLDWVNSLLSLEELSACEARAAILESLAYDGVDVRAASGWYWEADDGYVRPQFRKGA